MRIIIFSNGDISSYNYIKRYIKDYDYVICADGGIRHTDILGIIPDLIVGDLDSAPGDLLKKYRELGVRIDSFPTEKDDTDTQIAVDTAIDLEPDEIVLAGAIGDRWDHSYANMMLLYRIVACGIKSWIVDDKNLITLSNSTLVLYADIGQTLSLLPFGGDVYIKSTSGLKYPIMQGLLTTDYPIGISNVFIEEQVKIEVESGYLLTIMTRE